MYYALEKRKFPNNLIPGNVGDSHLEKDDPVDKDYHRSVSAIRYLLTILNDSFSRMLHDVVQGAPHS